MRLLHNTFFFIFFALAFMQGEQAYAEQKKFNRNHEGARTAFYYKWVDLNGRLQEVSFALPNYDLGKGTKEFKPFNNKRANEYVYDVLKDHIGKRNNKTLELKLIRRSQGFEIEARGVSKSKVEKEVAQLQALKKKALDDYIRKNFYSYVNETTVMPDHPRISKRYVKAMRPVATAIAEKVGRKNSREIINYTLSFLQTIPYDRLQSRYTSNGAGFQTPYGLLHGNRGDCDTKSVAFAAIMRSFYPKLRMVMVYVPGHAFIGLNFHPQPGDKALRIGGTTFVLAEPVGPAQVPVGKIAPESEVLLAKGDFSYQEIPF